MKREVSAKKFDALRLEIEALRARFTKVSEVGRRITEVLDFDALLQEIVDGACSLTNARYGAVGVFDDSGHVRRFITSGEPHQPGGSPEEPTLLRFLKEI